MMEMIVVPPFHQRCPLQATRFRPTQRHMIIEPQMPQISHANPEYRDHTPQDDATQREYYSGKKRPYAEEYGDVDAGQVDRLSGSHV